jgi:hypothetical protein
MNCKNHPNVPAANRCSACAEAFCDNCLVEVAGKKYCSSCKVMAVQNVPIMEEAAIPCKEADSALWYSLIGLLCFGIILEPIAIGKALQAKKLISESPRLTGEGKANAALIIAIIGLVLWVIGLIYRFSHTSGY